MRPGPRHPYARGGSTCAANLSAKSRRAHQHKTCGQWTTRQDLDGSITWTTGTGRTYTTYPMQYDPTASGLPELLGGADREATRGDARGNTRDGHAGFLDPDQIDLAEVIDHAELAQGIDHADHAHEEGPPPIEYRDQGTTATTRPARRLLGGPSLPSQPPVRAERPDPGPPPF